MPPHASHLRRAYERLSETRSEWDRVNQTKYSALRDNTSCWNVHITCTVVQETEQIFTKYTESKLTPLKNKKMRLYTGCPRRNVPHFGRVFLMLKYTDITQNTYVQSWTVTEIMAREKSVLLAGPRTVPVSSQVLSIFVLECGVLWRKFRSH